VKIGERVTTPRGEGVLLGFEPVHDWRREIVKLDSGKVECFYPADNVRPKEPPK
jgi:hypothetical protein